MSKFNKLALFATLFVCSSLFAMQERLDKQVTNKLEIFGKTESKKAHYILATLKNKLTTILPRETVIQILFELIGDQNADLTPELKLNIALEFLCDQEYSNFHKVLIDYIYRQIQLSHDQSPYKKLVEISQKNKDHKKNLRNIVQACFKKDVTSNPLLSRVNNIILDRNSDANVNALNELVCILNSGAVDISTLSIRRHYAQQSLLDSPLHRCSVLGNINMAEKILENGGNSNFQNNNGWTPLMNSSVLGNIKIAKLLLNYDADPNVQDKCGTTALMCASRHNNIEIVKILLKAAANINSKCDEGMTALLYAAQFGCTEVVKLLLNYNADPNLQNRWQNALILASSFNKIETVKALLNGGSRINLKNIYGETALIYASCLGHTEIVKTLLDTGAHIDLKSNFGWPALIYAASDGHFEVVRVFLEAGANLEIFNKKPELFDKIKNVEIKKLIFNAMGKEYIENQPKEIDNKPWFIIKAKSYSIM